MTMMGELVPFTDAGVMAPIEELAQAARPRGFVASHSGRPLSSCQSDNGGRTLGQHRRRCAG